MNTDIHLLENELGETEDYTLPCVEALLAGTLALMTAHTQACCDSHKQAVGQKVVANLFYLAQHPLLTPAFHTMPWNLRTRWELEMENAANARAQAQITPSQDARLWHNAAQAVQ